jgi:alpha-glucosidase
MADFGYDVADYTGVDPLFGSLEDFDRLVEEAHGRGIKVLLDFVPNHSSDEHPWFVESRSSWENPKRDWYIWRDAKPDGTPEGSPPNNWVEETGGPVWEWDERTEQYYLHSHFTSQPDLNWRNPAVREAMLDALRFWLDRGVDGFRIDVAHMIMKDPELRDNPPNPDPKPNPHDRQHSNFHSQLHVHDRQHPDLHGVYREIRKLLGSYGEDKVMIGEIEISSWESWTLYYGAELDEFQMPFNFQLIETPWEAGAVRAFVDAFEAALPEGAWPNYVLGNHDRPRIATRYGLGQARVAQMLLLTLCGTPTLYQGDELGMRDADIPLEKMQDLLGRDPTRTPMQWDASENAGFSSEGVEPWLPLADDYAKVNVEAQENDPSSMLALFRRLIALRRETPALAAGSYRSLDASDEEVFAYLREHEGEQILVALNFGPEPRTLDLSAASSAIAGEVLCSTGMDRVGEEVDLSRLELRGDEGCLVRLGG